MMHTEGTRAKESAISAVSVAEQGRDHLVLLRLATGEERLEPILKIGPPRLEILLRNTPRESALPGTDLSGLRLFASGICALESSARIEDVSEVLLADGSSALRVGLHLLASEGPTGAMPGADVYTQGKMLRETLSKLVEAQTRVLLTAAGHELGEPYCTAAARRIDPGTAALVAEMTSGIIPVGVGDRCDLHAEIYGTRLQVTARLRDQIPGRPGPTELRFDWPEAVWVWRRRVDGRLRHFDEPLTVATRLPFEPHRSRHHVVDLSTGGVAFAGPSDDHLMRGMKVPWLTIHLPVGSIRARGQVRSLRRGDDGKQVVGVSLEGMDASSQAMLAQYVRERLHPDVRLACPADLPQLWPVYDAAGLVQITQADRVHGLRHFEVTRRTLLARGSSILLQVVGTSHDEPHATGELLQFFDQTWCLQQIATRDSARSHTADLLGPLLRAAMGRPDFACFNALLDAATDRTVVMRLREAAADPRSLCLRDWVLMTGEKDLLPPEQLAADVQKAGPADRAWIAGRLRHLATEVEREALCLDESRLELHGVARLYRTLGLSRQRMIRIAVSISDTPGFALIEHASPAISLQPANSVTRVFATRGERNARRAAVIALAFDALQIQRSMGTASGQILASTSDAVFLEEAGLTRVGTRIEASASRDGAARLIQLLSFGGHATTH